MKTNALSVELLYWLMVFGLNIDYHSNLVLKSLVAEIPVFCPNQSQGCSFIIPFESLEAHVQNECELVSRYCICHPEGCNFKGVSSERTLHLDSCVFYKLRSFISSTAKRLEQLELKLQEQEHTIRKLQQSNTPTMKTMTYTADVADTAIVDMKCVNTIQNIGSGVTSIISLDDQYFAGCYDGTVRIFDSVSGLATSVASKHSLSVWSLAIEASKNLIFSGASDGNVNSWDISNSSITFKSTSLFGRVKIYSLLVYRDLLLAATSDGTVHILNHQLKPVGKLIGHAGGINSVRVNDDSIYTASSDKTIKIWDLSTSTCLATLPNHSSEILDVVVNDKILFGSTYGSEVVAYNLNNYSKIKTLTGHNWVMIA